MPEKFTSNACFFHLRFRRQDSILHRLVLLLILVVVGIVEYKNSKDNSWTNLTLMEKKFNSFSADRKMQLSRENQKFDCCVH